MLSARPNDSAGESEVKSDLSPWARGGVTLVGKCTYGSVGGPGIKPWGRERQEPGEIGFSLTKNCPNRGCRLGQSTCVPSDRSYQYPANQRTGHLE
jgi:hypothetical protein